jgi:hypothetical protein
LSTDTEALNVISVNAYPAARGYEGHFVLPLDYDTNITNELTDRMNKGTRGKYDEFVFIDQSNTRYKARDLWLIRKDTDNYYSYEADYSARATGATIFHFRCNDFSQA